MKEMAMWMLTMLIFNGLLALASMGIAAEDIWVRKSDMPTGRSGLATSVVDGKIYAIGGVGDLAKWESLSTVEEYDPLKDTWTKRTDMSTGRIYASASAVNGKIYVIGGGIITDNGEERFLSTVEEYDPSTDTWSTRADMPTPRYALATCVVNGKIYTIGGWDGKQALPTVECYDPATDTWVRKAHMPTPRWELSATVMDEKIYAIGRVSIVEEYDPATDAWTRKADMPTVRSGFSTSVVDGKIYAIGGRIDPGVVEEYDPLTDTWIGKADMPTLRCCLSTSVVNGRIYAIGGATLDAVVAAVEEYTPEVARAAVSLQYGLTTLWGKIKQTR